MEKTPIAEAIEKLQNTQATISEKSPYAVGYNGALIDCIVALKKLLPKEKEMIEKAVNSTIAPNIKHPKFGAQYFNENYTQK